MNSEIILLWWGAAHAKTAVTRYQPQSDKIMRRHAQTAMIENGFVHLPKERHGSPNTCTS